LLIKRRPPLGACSTLDDLHRARRAIRPTPATALRTAINATRRSGEVQAAGLERTIPWAPH
jgi:hypothetical protein